VEGGAGRESEERSVTSGHITLFMCGDIMTGRGIDQVLPHAGDPRIFEPYMKSATGYVELAEEVNGPIPKPVDFSYIWGDALDELRRVAHDVRIVNLETAVTKSDEYWKGKGVNYRMNPENIPCITVAGINCCALANNHVLDWGYPGLAETLETLKRNDVAGPGAGRDLREAESPAVFEVEDRGRVLVFSFGSGTAGIPSSWTASDESPGINMLRDMSGEMVGQIAEKVRKLKERGDIVVLSVHWGGNWGYEIPQEQREFARGLIDRAGVDVIHGHSSHHIKGIEVYKNKLILYGCGDFLNDYEGIGGYGYFRGDLGLMYFACIDPSTGKLVSLVMTPTQVKHFKVNRAARADAQWLTDVLNREGKKFGTQAELSEDDIIALRWD
jgi:poly-gamma-glutamate capsule biosynthesis protein CapA/YwtB (metallophosphatase superfamily)